MPQLRPSPKFGRTPRSFSPRVPHFSALASGVNLPPLPASVDYTNGLGEDFGMMLNDNLGDCTCAAYYHARQIWTSQAQNTEATEPDIDVEELYIEACGYDPDVPGPGPGGNEQFVLTYLLNTGAPTGTDGAERDRILAFVEVDSRNTDDVKRTIYDCGVAYIGFQVPANVTYDNRTWDYDPQAPMTNDGHAVVLARLRSGRSRSDFVGTKVQTDLALRDQDRGRGLRDRGQHLDRIRRQHAGGNDAAAA